MLISYHVQKRLANEDVPYAAFVLAARETVCQMERGAVTDDLGEGPRGFLAEVPFLQQVPLAVQIELLAETWQRHNRDDAIEATLLDAAVVYAACATAGRLVAHCRSLVLRWLAEAPRAVQQHVLPQTTEQWVDVCDDWWDDRDFLMIDEFQDMPPEEAQYVRWLLRLSEAMIQTMFDALQRGRPSRDSYRQLEGLLTTRQIRTVQQLLVPNSHS